MKEKRTPVKIEPKHLGQVDHLHDVQEKAIRHKVDRPLLLAEPVITAVGFEDESGKLKGAFYIEAVPECSFVGIDPTSTQAAIEAAPYVVAFLQEKGYRWLNIKIPKGKRLPKKLKKFLEQAGFYEDKVSVLFTRDMRGK